MEPALVMLMSPLVKLIIDKLGPFITTKVTLPWQIRGKLRNFQRQMRHIHTVLLAAEKPGLLAAELWKQELKNVLYDMEDLLDDIETGDSRRVTENQCSIGKMVSNSTLFGYNDIIDIENALARIKEDTKDYNSMVELVAGKQDYELCEKWTQPTHSFLGAESLIERRDEKEKIVEFLLSDNKDADSLSIVGIGGLGKTELAKMVCNDNGMKQKFEVKWAHVSFREFDLRKIVCEILGRTKTKSTLQELLNILQEELHDKTYLFVLDDVWDMNPVQWNELKNLLLKINKGNKVLITTRYRPIADRADNIIGLKPLSPDLCSPLIEKYAELANPSRVPVEVIQKCEGVPLAAITLGLMMFKTTLRDGNVWSLTEPGKDSNIMHSLKLSYDNLKFHVKRCFEYHVICNDKIDKERLVQMWIAQGFIQQTDEQQAFKELEYASLFSDVKEDISCQRTHFEVLRLFHDLAFLVSTDYSYIRKPYNKPAFSSTTRHVLLSAQTQTQQVQDSLFELKKLRTFVGPHDIKLLLSFKKLRVLDLCLSDFEKVPDFIGNMKHLRYLDLSQNQRLKELPRSIGKLFNLKTLRVDKCGRLRGLSDDVAKLIHLRHLYVSSQQASLEFRSLISLQTLHLENLCNLVKLPDMSHCTALKTLGIFNCPLICFEGNELKDLKNLRRLALVNLPELVNFPKLATISEGEDHSDQKLTSLCLSECGGLRKLPEWFRTLASLERLTIDDCHELILKDSSMVSHVKEIYLNKAKFKPTSESDCHEPTQKPEKGGETGDDIHEGEGSRYIPESSNIASSSLDRNKLKRKRAIDAN